VINDAQLGTPLMKNDAAPDVRNKEAIKHMGDFKNQPKPPKLQLRNEDAIRNMGDPTKVGPSADESKKAARRGKKAKAKAKAPKAAGKRAGARKAGSRVVAADRPVAKPAAAASKPVVAPGAPVQAQEVKSAPAKS
jgi:hypothetical protein